MTPWPPLTTIYDWKIVVGVIYGKGEFLSLKEVTDGESHDNNENGDLAVNR